MSDARDMVDIRRPSGNMFAEVPKAKIPRSQFDRSHGLKTTFNVDEIVPIYVDEVLPGDTFTMQVKGFARLFSPLKAPIMDNLHLDIHFFYVPYRILWDNWEKFNGAQEDPGDSIDFTIPVLADGHTVTPAANNMDDYLGLPIGLQTTQVEVSALPFRAYRMIYNQWYRDQNLIDSVLFVTDDGPDSTAETGVSSIPLKRAKKHDYFTSALPWPQKGDAVSIPLGTVAPVVGFGKQTQTFPTTSQNAYETGGSGFVTYLDAAEINPAAANTSWWVEEDVANAGFPAVFADLTDATAATINQLRQAFQIQRLLERDARAGTRYVEILKAHFGVTSPDFRLQRAEYLGGGKSFINISPVAQTGQTATTPQGTLTAVGTGDITGAGFAKSFVEHGIILGLASARADLTYQQGLERFWSRQTRYDFFWPALANIGEQSILKKELFVTNVPATDDAVFGYQERYAEYRYAPSRITGKFRSDATGSLDLWHLAQDFSGSQSLNQSFIEYNTPMARIQAVTTEPDLIFDCWFNLKCARPMPLYGVPGMIDHF